MKFDIGQLLFGSRRALQSAGTLTAGRIVELLKGPRSKAGTHVTPDSALRVSAFWQAINLLSGDIAKCDINVWRYFQPRGREVAKDHPAHRMLHVNIGGKTANTWRQVMMANALIYGNAYSRITWRGTRPVAMEFIPSRNCEPKFDETTGRTTYTVYHDADRRTTSEVEETMFHLKGLQIDIEAGLSLYEYARDVIGRQIARNDYQAEFFSNQAVPSGWFVHPGEMSEQAQERFLKGVERRHQGEGRRHRIGILEDGMKWQQLGINPIDAMLIEGLNLGRDEIAAIFNIPVHRLGNTARAAFNTLEEENKSYISTSLGIWFSRIEHEAEDKLFAPSEKDTMEYQVQFNRDQLATPSFAVRMNAHARVVLSGIRSVNEVREDEGWNPVPGGDDRLIPVNVQPQDTLLRSEAQDDDRIRGILERDIERMCDRLSQYIHRWAIVKGELPRGLDQLQEKHLRVLQDTFLPYCDDRQIVDELSEAILSAATSRWIQAANVLPDEVDRALERANGLLVGDMRKLCHEKLLEL